jgi:NADH-quinone oxidoreductase subunit N
LLWLAVIALIFAVVGAYYYIRLVKMIYFDAPEDTNAIVLTRIDTALYSVNALLLLYFGIFPAGLIYLCMDAMK